MVRNNKYRSCSETRKTKRSASYSGILCVKVSCTEIHTKKMVCSKTRQYKDFLFGSKKYKEQINTYSTDAKGMEHTTVVNKEKLVTNG